MPLLSHCPSTTGLLGTKFCFCTPPSSSASPVQRLPLPPGICSFPSYGAITLRERATDPFTTPWTGGATHLPQLLASDRVRQPLCPSSRQSAAQLGAICCRSANVLSTSSVLLTSSPLIKTPVLP